MLKRRTVICTVRTLVRRPYFCHHLNSFKRNNITENQLQTRNWNEETTKKKTPVDKKSKDRESKRMGRASIVYWFSKTRNDIFKSFKFHFIFLLQFRVFQPHSIPRFGEQSCVSNVHNQTTNRYQQSISFKHRIETRVRKPLLEWRQTTLGLAGSVFIILWFTGWVCQESFA